MSTLNKKASEIVTGEHRTSPGHAGTGALAEPALSDRGSRTAPADPSSAPDSDIHALTDITGFGLIGHLREMLLASDNVSAELRANRIPLLDGAIDCVRARHIPGGLNANREFAECLVEYTPEISDDIKTLLFDPQTSGGLLIAVSEDRASELLELLKAAEVPAANVGKLSAGSKPLVRVIT
jgi:selenide,water dikinase